MIRSRWVTVTFQSTLPAWGETRMLTRPREEDGISIHSPRMGRDRAAAPRRRRRRIFQSTLPAWGETRGTPSACATAGFQSTLPAWGETGFCACSYIRRKISIHSPRMGRDRRRRLRMNPLFISIHSPRMGRDVLQIPDNPTCYKISIHSPRMGRDELSRIIPRAT